MSIIKPFRGLRPIEKQAENIASPPYDVINSEEARQACRDNPYSFLRIVKPEVDLDADIDLYDPRVYQQGAENMAAFRQEGYLVQDDSPCFYVYKQKMGDHVQVGLVACASCADYERDIIKKHEKTREDKELDRTRHILALNANTGPVFLTFRHDDQVDALLTRAMERTPAYDFTSPDGVQHTFFVVPDREWIAAIRRRFQDINPLYVADGHHRSASATRVMREKKAENPGHRGNEEYNFFLTVIFPDNQMNIMAYNRVVRDLAGLQPDAFLKRLEDAFTVTPSTDKEPVEKHSYCMYIGGRWYTLKAKPGSFDAQDPVDRLDASILQNNLLAPVLDIHNPRTDERIDFVGGIRGVKELERLVDSGNFTVAFSLYPTSVKELIEVADAGRLMPPKSTWFEPKLRSGMIVHLLD